MARRRSAMLIESKNDPFNMSTDQTLSEQALSEDEKLKQQLDSVDSKISECISMRDAENRSAKLIEDQINEAKDSFYFAFQQLKIAKAQLKDKQSQIAPLASQR